MKGRRVKKGRLTTRMIGSEDTFPRLPLDPDKPRFVQHAGSPKQTLSLRRRTAHAPLKTPGLLKDGRKAEGMWERLTGTQRTNKCFSVKEEVRNEHTQQPKYLQMHI